MKLSDKFYQGNPNICTLTNPVPAPLFRKEFTLQALPQRFEITVCGLGIYELFVNGIRVTKGYLAPYRSNLNHYLYYDNYNLTEHLHVGQNVVALTLGNGMNSSIVKTWLFSKFAWRSAPKFALCAELDGKQIFDASEFVTADGEVTFNDYHCTEFIDARRVKHGWNNVGFDDSDWQPVTEAVTPSGEMKLCTTPPITCYKVEKPCKVWKGSRGYIYDFGTSGVGTYKLTIQGDSGQVIYVCTGDGVQSDGKIFNRNLLCGDRPVEELEYIQRDTLTLSGGIDTFEPRFTAKGFRFAEIIGIDEKQAQSLQIEYYYFSGAHQKSGDFRCNNKTVNKLQQLTVNSDISNILHFPLDCPQREKNGWTGDTVLSCEQFLLNLDCVENLKEWLHNICKAQHEDGAIPGIVPTDTWGYEWGAGPGWDKILFEVPYRIWVYTGDEQIIRDCAPYMLKYLKYMQTKRDDKGLFAYGLEDWLPVHVHTPLVETDTMLCKSIADIASECFGIIGWKDEQSFAKQLSDSIRDSFRKYLYKQDVVDGYGTQCGQAMGLYFGMNSNEDKFVYLKKLDTAIRQAGEHMDFGALGNRVFWRVVAEEFGIDRVLNIMLRKDYPSFGAILRYDPTTLWEGFVSWEGTMSNIDKYLPNGEWSFNHHFWGDISAVFYRYLAGIRIDKPNFVNFAPMFAKDVTKVVSWHNFASGKLQVKISHGKNKATALVEVPQGVQVQVTPPNGWKTDVSALAQGTNKVVFVRDKNYTPKQYPCNAINIEE